MHLQTGSACRCYEKIICSKTTRRAVASIPDCFALYLFEDWEAPRNGLLWVQYDNNNIMNVVSLNFRVIIKIIFVRKMRRGELLRTYFVRFILLGVTPITGLHDFALFAICLYK